ncbi:MAG: Ig-like domain-containing protein [Acidimicrobiaceae bacterium]|nr:Ig-like domain-containing protein [Acidimicrobiaceae bacterium]
MSAGSRRFRRIRALAVALLTGALVATVLTAVSAPATAQSPAGVRLAVANVTSLSDMGTAASLVAAGAADAVLFARSATELGPEAELIVARHSPASAVLVGGTAALGSKIESQLLRFSPDVAFSRLAGADRIDTAARAAQLSATASSGITAVIAYGWSLPDVGTAASLVATGGGDVVLYSHRDRLGAPTRDAIARLRPTRLVIIGGPAAISPTVVTELAAVAPGTSVARREGATRIETATAAAEPAFDAGATHAVIANGWSERDAGIAAALAAADADAAVLYTDRRGRLTDAVAAVISHRRPIRATLVGDVSRLPSELADEIAARSASTRIDRLGDLECPATVGEATARAALLGRETASATQPGASPSALTVAIESCAPHYVDGLFEVRFSFSKPLDDLDDSDVYVVNGEMRHLIGSEARHRAVIEPAAAGAVLVRIPHGAVRSADGARNDASAPFVRVHSIHRGLPAAGLDTWNRRAVMQGHEDEFGRREPDSDYTGDLRQCNEGTTSAAFRLSVVQRTNWYRAMAGLDPVTEVPELSQGAQAAALMMLAEGRLSHFPEPDWACHSETGAAIAGASNLGLGNAGVSGIDSYMRDNGDNNLPVGHRRWILYPQLLEVGTGNAWHSRSRFRAANALDVISGDRRQDPVLIREPRGFVAWPPAGFVPARAVWGRWSFSLADADFENAMVTMVDESQTVSTRVLARGPGAGDHGIVWAVAGDRNSNLLGTPRNGDRCYAVTIDGVRVEGDEQPAYEYPVCVIDPSAQVGPTVDVSSDAPRSVGSTFEVTIDFDDDVDGFTHSDVDVHNGVVTEFSGSGSRYNATIRADDNGDVVVTVRAGAVHDVRNRPNPPSVPLVRTADVGRPVATLSSPARATVSGSFDVTIEFSEPVTGLDLSDIRVVNGTAAGLRGSGSSYRATISPTGDGTVMIRLLQDAAANDDGRANAASQPLTRLRTAGGRATGIGLDTWDRSGLLRSYAEEFGRDEPDAGFAGDVSACEAGTTSSEYRSSVVRRLNWYRAAAGLSEVSENAAHTRSAQLAALWRSAQPAALWYLADAGFPVTPGAACYSVEAADAASGGLGSLGRQTGRSAVDRYMRSGGSHNLRRNILAPHLRQVGIGHASNPDSRYRSSFMLYTDYGDAWGAARPRVREVRGFVPWPPNGFVAQDLVPLRWSFSLANADYSDAIVTVADHVGPLPAKVISEDTWYREHSLVWEVDVSATDVRARRPTGADHCFAVRLDGVRIGNADQAPFEYAVCVVESAE